MDSTRAGRPWTTARDSLEGNLGMGGVLREEKGASGLVWTLDSELERVVRWFFSFVNVLRRKREVNMVVGMMNPKKKKK
jgi:hypothetical protein